jgi:predicted enzyme related to lactoylglutathione lyase
MAKWTAGHFVWYEHMTKDPKAAIEFYSDVVGWKTQAWEGTQNYTMWVGSQGPIGGVTTIPERAAKAGSPPFWSASVQVDDVDASAKAAKANGGQVHVEPMDIPTVGRYAVIVDPQGAALALFKPGGDGMDARDNTKPGEFGWHELLTTDHGAAFRFYSGLFGWEKLREVDAGGPVGKYLVFGKGNEQYGGMFTKSKDMPMPPSWLYYANVADLGTAVGKAKKRGAKVMIESMEVPGGGKIAQLIDPQGAAFALFAR